MRNVIQIAQSWIDGGLYVESAGPNRGPAIDALEHEFGMIGQPWCAMWANGAGRQATREGASGRPWPLIAGSQALLAWFRAKGLVSADPQDMAKWRGALAIRTDPAPNQAHGHVVMVAQRFTQAGQIVAFLSCEGNTNKDGGSNGDRAWNHRRTIPQPGTWHYVDVSTLAGGSYWTAGANV